MRIPVNATLKTVDYLDKVCLHGLNSRCFKIKIITIKCYVFMKIRPSIGHRIRIGRRLHVNQPLRMSATGAPLWDMMLDLAPKSCLRTVILT